MEWKMMDFGPVHQRIKELHYFNNDTTWIYNGAGCYVDKDRFVYVCRARGERGTSSVAAQYFVRSPKEYFVRSPKDDTRRDWVPSTAPVLLRIKTFAGGVGEDGGPQDARAFMFEGQPWIVFNMLNTKAQRQMFISSVNNGAGVPIPLSIRNTEPRPVEKNWTPFVHNSRLHFVYSFVPLVIVALMDVSTGECIVIYAERSPARPEYRGGTPAIETSTGVFEGYLHTTRPIGSGSPTFDPNELPLPARSTANWYRTCRFQLNFTGNVPRLSLGPETSYFGKQVELVYGWDGHDEVILNVNDKITVALTTDARVPPP